MEKNPSNQYTDAASSDPIRTERMMNDFVNSTLLVNVSHPGSWASRRRDSGSAAVWGCQSPLRHHLAIEHQVRRKGTDAGARRASPRPQTPDLLVADHASEISPATRQSGPSETPGVTLQPLAPRLRVINQVPGAPPSFHFLNLTATS